MKKLEMIIKPEKLDDVKKILDDSKANGDGHKYHGLWCPERFQTYLQR